MSPSPMPLALMSPRTDRSHLSCHPPKRKMSLIWGGSPLLQTAIIERAGQSNLRWNREDEDFRRSMVWERGGGYLDGIEDET